MADTTIYPSEPKGQTDVHMPRYAAPDTTIETSRFVEELRGILPRYSVVLHNDDVHSMDFVVAALLKSVRSLAADEAVRIMLEAHNTGRAVVITCPLEHAELYRDRLRSFQLGATIEKV